jgi:cytosine/adenosine deaminase-related metal-dependent hydrolase
MIYRAPYVLPVTGDVIEDGAIRVENGVICEIGKFQEFDSSKSQIRDCHPLVLMPGLINCHTHLEEGALRCQLDVPPNFTSWYTRSSKYFHQFDTVKRLNAARLGCRESLYYGTTTIADTASTGASFLILREEAIRSMVFILFKGMVPWEAQSCFEQEVEKRIRFLEDVYPFAQIGLSPQAPYSTSMELYRLGFKKAKQNQMLFQTHLSESSEELEMFTSHTGPLFEYSQRLHPMELRSYAEGPVAYLLKNNLLPSKSLVVHGNYLSSSEIEVLARRKASLVHCARSHLFFGHKAFPFETTINRGLNVCLGTESLASVDNLNLFDDIHLIKRKHPQLDSKTILEFATINGAKALGLEQQLGALSPGYQADVIGVRIMHQPGESLYDDLALGDPQVEFVMIRGEEVII